MDSQIIEMLGRNRLTDELLRAGLEVAVPARDRGIDLIAYADLESRVDSFVARPIQMKAASRRIFGLDRKYRKFPGMLIAYVWKLAVEAEVETYAMTYGEALAIADEMGWTRTESWRRGSYTNTRPGKRLRSLLERHRMTPERWWARVTGRGLRAVQTQEASPRERPADPAPRWTEKVEKASGPIFRRYVGIDYSGAKTPTSSLPGLRVYLGDRDSPPAEIEPPPSPRKYWTRRGVAEWLIELLAEGPSAVVGIDHAFSFPMPYFQKHGLAPDWDAFIDDFQRHWPTDGDNVYVDFVRDGLVGNGAGRTGNNRWRRLTDRYSGGAKSVFHFDVQGSVAKSTHSGIPWLRVLRRTLGGRLHFWPFDGWQVPDGKSVVAEVYPALWNKGFPRQGRTPDQHDAYSVARWLREADLDGRLLRSLDPPLSPDERALAETEGWILGVQPPRD